ncbi:type I-G CRISPR-associated helicase/endonuclease Cas3g [Yinghuangia seranimata]|uniref:type I-G CRISPR-associated helicase/endonuclease Cas3g n=1 Tax=Yinghuangia seranimata TaxID=408067 RepID=UPI00248CE39E|nr:CRISPR-associated endonuclease Cas3'' [Yinghuangia seranimata]MDI2125519.1 CRISPR-associated endonuclease Cas3'' [Yinghuangia seranimata]
MTSGFGEFFHTATGYRPYAYQAGLAESGLPRFVRVPSGGGKTAAAVLAWLYRRLVSAPEETPRRLAYVLPQGGLADQTHTRIAEWLRRLGYADEVDLHLLAGPESQNGTWRRYPERTAILVGTHDVLLSRALMRGFADSRTMAPVSFGLLNTDTHWVFDEMHLLGPGLPTSTQLQSLRESLGTTAPTHSTWMSSTRDGDPEIGAGEAPTGGHLSAIRRIRRLAPDPTRYVQDLVDALGSAHVPGTQTVAVLGSAQRAREVYGALRNAHPDREIVLAHPYARSVDRRDRAAALEDTGRDRILVTTRALDAGCDVSSRTLLTELAPWSALVQRAGRCNRHGEHPDGGDLLWCVPPEGPGADVGVATWLNAHEGEAVTTADLFHARVDPDTPPSQTLHEHDVLAMFDNARGAAPTDASPWIRADEDRTVFVAWRTWESGEPAEDDPEPARTEQCEAPLADVRELLDGGVWLRDPADGRWRHAVADDLRSGSLLVVDSARGGYLPELGWAPESDAPVPSLFTGRRPPTTGCVAWVSLDQHLLETEEEARAVMAGLPGLTEAQREAVAHAARFHDLGKCHDVFQAMLRDGGGDPPDDLLAKSKAPWNNGVSARPYFRHELVSALILLNGEYWHTPSVDPRLVAYLVAAHHGQVRVSVRPETDEDELTLLGVRNGDHTPPVTITTGDHFPAQSLDTEAFRQGGSWTPQTLALRDRDDLGPFRLAYLESLVRVADWRSSARHDGPTVGLVP